MNQNIYINEIPSAELTIYDNGTPVTVVIANGAVLQNKVPYTGATQNVNLGEYGISAGFVQLDTTPTTYTPAVGNMGWNDSEGTIDLLLKGGIVSLPLGQKQVARVVNGTGGNVLKSNYQVVKVTGAQGQRLQVNLAQANNDANSADTLGLIAENINNNNSGFIITSGLVENINTTGSLQSETWTDGNVLYLSPTTPGAITNVKPQAPNHTVIVGFVVYAHANNGKIFVKVDNGYELDELHNVLINTGTLANGQVLKYNSSLQVWENNTDAGGITGSGTSGQVAYWNGTTTQTGSNNLFWDAANNRLGIGTNAPAYTLDVNGAIRTTGLSVSTGYSFSVQRLQFNNGIAAGNIGYIIGTSNGVIRLMNAAENDFTRLQFGGTTNSFPALQKVSSSLAVVDATGTTLSNLLIGSTTDSGQRLQVTGDTLLKGSGNTSATTALTVQNSDGTVMFSSRNDGLATVSGNLNLYSTSGTSVKKIETYWNSTTVYGLNIQGNATSIGANDIPNLYIVRIGSGFGVAPTPNGDYYNVLAQTGTFSPTSGLSRYSILGISGVINQTGTATGITRGLYVNPTLTAAADWRSIEWSNNSGWGLYGAGTANNYLAGSLGIGSTTLTGHNLRVTKNITGATTAYGIYVDGVVQSDVTSTAYGMRTFLTTQAAAFTVTNLIHYAATQTLQGAGSTIGTQVGFDVLNMNNGNTNIAFRGQMTSGVNVWNLYMNGTALNYLNGNLLLGTTTDAGQKLQVTGDTLLTGSTSNGTANALRVNNSSSVNLLTVRNDGVITIGTSNAGISRGATLTSESPSGSILYFNSASTFDNTGNSGQGIVITSRATSASTAVNSQIFSIAELGAGYAPTSGSLTRTYFQINATINQTGGANGITRGLYVNPTLTAAADWRSIETSNNTGYALYLGGSADAFFNDATDFQFGTTTGTKIGTATSQKLGFWNATPIVQPTTGVASATRVGGGGTTLTDTDTFDGYTLAQIVKALRNTGILA